ncbi:MAG TPA: SUF system NifU family Fe-S cluster assembly protein [Gammaproteobacteria bacterium]|nr:SUF system NifU family Fe-S cluster assembly protein [Gammaproteobacteria bacterium]
MMDLDNLYQELIIDHGTEPRNHHALEKANCDAEGYNPLCGDKVHVYLLVEDDAIKDISFLGKGCAISTASASIMTEVLKSKTIPQAKEIFAHFQHLLTSEDPAPESLGKLAALTGVRKFPSRVKCATLAWHTMQDALKGRK